MKYSINRSSRCDFPSDLLNSDGTHKETGELYYGFAGSKPAGFFLFVSDDGDFTPKKGCTLFRYSSRATQGVMFPIACINEEKGLMYFWDADRSKWIARGLKLDFLCIAE